MVIICLFPRKEVVSSLFKATVIHTDDGGTQFLPVKLNFISVVTNQGVHLGSFCFLIYRLNQRKNGSQQSPFMIFL